MTVIALPAGRSAYPLQRALHLATAAYRATRAAGAAHDAARRAAIHATAPVLRSLTDHVGLAHEIAEVIADHAESHVRGGA